METHSAPAPTDSKADGLSNDAQWNIGSLACNRSRTATMFAGGLFGVALLLQSTSCTRPQLVEDATLNQERLYEIVERTSRVSRMEVIHPLSVKLVGREEIRTLLHDNRSSITESDKREAIETGRKIMGLTSNFNNANAEHHALLSRTALGMYLPQKKTLYLVAEPARSAQGGIHLSSLGNLGQEITLAHEIIHALQHQHYPFLFEPKQRLWGQQMDATLSLHAAIEGDATLWSTHTAGFRGAAKDPEKVIEESQDAWGPFADLSVWQRDLLTFPYTYGYRFAYHEGKAALESPPASTEQILHSDGGRRRSFQAIDLSAFGRSIEQKGCRAIHQDTLGELMLSWWIRNLDANVPRQAWEGWDGDRWITAQCEEQEIAWLTSWDTESDAIEFKKALAGVIGTFQARATLSSLIIERQGQDVVLVSHAFEDNLPELKRFARRARVTTRHELAAHFFLN